MNKLNIIQVILIALIMFLPSCMEDLTEPVEIKYHNSADLITYLETNGDYINSDENLSIVTIDDAYANLSNYFIMDMRTTVQFQSGHIEEAHNFKIDELIDSLEFNNVSLEATLLLISESGQKAAYATSLLRMYGYTDVYSLDFGMAQWNAQFSDVMINARNDSEWWFIFKVAQYPKPKKENKLPSVVVDGEYNSIEELVKNRIKWMLSEEQFLNAISTIQEMDATYSLRYSKYVGGFLFCYDDLELYNIQRYFKDLLPPATWGGTPRTAAFYDAKIDFKASTNLLTLPVDKTIYNYTFNGQRSFYITAYLRLLGYNAKSIHYGAVSMMYYKLELGKKEKSFREADIRNYPIVN